MAASLVPSVICASSAAPTFARRGPSSSSTPSSGSGWWTPLFGWSSDPDYIDSNPGSSRKTDAIPAPDSFNSKTSARFAPGGFTEEKARQLRMMTRDSGSFHDVMYHSAIASRLASDFRQGQNGL